MAALKLTVSAEVHPRLHAATFLPGIVLLRISGLAPLLCQISTMDPDLNSFHALHSLCYISSNM